MALYLRDARASYDSRYLGASQEREQITIWKTDPPAVVTTVKPGFSDGRLRHAIDPINRVIYAGLWEDGLTAYDFESKQVLWRRTDLIGIQTVDLSAGFPRSVFVTLEAPDYRLDEPGVDSGIAELD